MKIYKYYAILFIFCFTTVSAQEIELKDLEMPNTSAANLIDINGSIIESPNTVKEFFTNLQNSFASNGLPTQYAIEIAPVRLFDIGKNTHKTEYFLNTNANGKINPFGGIKDFSLSVAYNNLEEQKLSKIAIGFNTNLIRAYYKGKGKDIKEYQNKFNNSVKLTHELLDNLSIMRMIVLEAKHKNDRKVVDDYYKLENEMMFSKIEEISKEIIKLKSKKDSIEKITPDITNMNLDGEIKDKEKAKKESIADMITLTKEYELFDAYWISTSANREMIQTKYENAFSKKPVFSLDIACAYNRTFNNVSFSENYFDRFGVWGTLNANIDFNKVNMSIPVSTESSTKEESKKDKESKTDKRKNKSEINKRNYLRFYVLGRFIRDGFDEMTLTERYYSAFDLGGKVEFEYKRFSIGYEYVKSFHDERGYRSVGQVKYQVNNQFQFTAGFGKNFDDTENTVSLFGINWGLQKSEKVSVKN